MSMGERIRELRKKNGLSQSRLANAVGVEANTISRWENNKIEASHVYVVKLANVLGTSADYLLGRESIPDAQPEIAPTLPKSNVTHIDVAHIPVIGNVRACCGNGNAYASDVEWEVIGYYPVPKSYLVGYSWQVGDGGFRCMRIEGDSMEPRLHENDMILFADMELHNGEFGLVKYSDRLLVRGVLFEGKKNVRLRALNKNYDDISIDLDKIELDFGIVGKVLMVLPQPQILKGGVL